MIKDLKVELNKRSAYEKLHINNLDSAGLSFVSRKVFRRKFSQE